MIGFEGPYDLASWEEENPHYEHVGVLALWPPVSMGQPPAQPTPKTKAQAKPKAKRNAGLRRR